MADIGYRVVFINHEQNINSVIGHDWNRDNAYQMMCDAARKRVDELSNKSNISLDYIQYNLECDEHEGTADVIDVLKDTQIETYKIEEFRAC